MASFTLSSNYENQTVPFTFDGGDTWTIAAGVSISCHDAPGVLSTFANSALVNDGNIVSADNEGVRFTGSDSSVTNNVGRTIVGRTTGIQMSGNSGQTVGNEGIVIGHTDFGVIFDRDTDTVLLTNSGYIYGRTVGVYLNSDTTGGVIRNSGEIRSDIFGVDVIHAVAGVRSIVVNNAHGIIQGAPAVETHYFGSIGLRNFGTIIGAIDCNAVNSTDNDVVRNLGRIQGQTFLGAGNDVFNGTGPVQGRVWGEDGIDKLTGGHAIDRLSGGLGNDILSGGLGAAKDFFHFDTAILPGANIDKINGFQVNIDKIVVDDDVFVGIGPVGALAAARFHFGTGFTTPTQRFNYNPGNGFINYDANGSNPGGNGAIHFATLARNLPVDNFDFIVSA